MKKFLVALFIIGAFILYSFLYRANPVALVPTPATKAGPSGSSSAPSAGSSPSVSGSNSAGTSSNPSTPATSGDKDGSYTGSVAGAHWGNIQVKATIQNGKVTNIEFLQYPDDRNRSIQINNYADPQLANEAIQAQSATVDIITGATDSSEAFMQSLSDALSQAKA